MKNKDTSNNNNHKNFQAINSFDSLCHLFIALLIKEEYYTSDKEKNNETERKGVMYYLNEINNLHLYGFEKGTQASDWKIYFQEQNNSNIYIGLKNLGCTCYMNSLFQVFYNITLFRESILKCKVKAENKNSLYELQKVFFNL